MSHSWASAGFSSVEALWRCVNCHKVVGFALKGLGEPWSDGVTVPDGIDAYVDPCDPKPVPLTDAEIEAAVGAGNVELMADLIRVGMADSGVARDKLTDKMAELGLVDAARAAELKEQAKP